MGQLSLFLAGALLQNMPHVKACLGYTYKEVYSDQQY